MNERIVDIAQNWTEATVQRLKDKYNRMGLRASGRWEKELAGNVQPTQTGVKVEIIGANYTYQLVHGRRPTAMNKRGRLYGVILQWVEDKRIRVDNKKRFAWLVAKKIDERGIKVPNKYNDGSLLADVELEVEKLKEQLQNEVSITVHSEVIKELM